MHHRGGERDGKEICAKKIDNWTCMKHQFPSRKIPTCTKYNSCNYMNVASQINQKVVNKRTHLVITTPFPIKYSAIILPPNAMQSELQTASLNKRLNKINKRECPYAKFNWLFLEGDTSQRPVTERISRSCMNLFILSYIFRRWLSPVRTWWMVCTAHPNIFSPPTLRWYHYQQNITLRQSCSLSAQKLWPPADDLQHKPDNIWVLHRNLPTTPQATVSLLFWVLTELLLSHIYGRS